MRTHQQALILSALAGAVACLGSWGGSWALAQSQSVLDSPHNLSATGPGAIRASSEQEVCVFCHAPHRTSGVRPLWNRETPASVYTPYSSSSLQAEPGQPTGSSKLCLSCHDGTIALGSVVSRGQQIHMAGGITTLPPGRSNLGTDLSDDHPISFRYDSSLVMRNPKLVDPRALPQALRLDARGELQCTTCHDAHDNRFGSFLTMSNDNSAMCRSCHRLSDTDVAGHTDCAGCHTPHTSPSGPYLLTGDRITSTCLSCHDGSKASDIASQLNRLSAHDTFSPIDAIGRTPTTAGLKGAPVSAGSLLGSPSAGLRSHTTCSDCHDPHTMSTGKAQAPQIPPSLGVVPGVTGSGAPALRASTEYEVCFRCHADQNVIASPTIPRQIAQTNTRLQFSPSAISTHPVQAPGRNSNVPSLLPPWTTGRMVACTDCHGSDTSRKAGGAGPDGPHGSNYAPLLLARYETADYTMESPSAYALCYRCHSREGPGGILQDVSFRYHRLHVVDHRTPCSVCHDSHGISGAQGSSISNAHLMNFDLSVVRPDPVTGRLEYRTQGTFSGACYLSCHGVNHSPKSY